MFAKRKANEREADMDPGIEVMMSYAKMERLRARLPPPEDVANAFTKFFSDKTNRGQPIEDTQAQLALQAARYCFDCQKVAQAETGLQSKLITLKTLNTVLETLGRSTDTATDAHVALARFVYENRFKKLDHQFDAASTYVAMLGAVGRPEEAFNVAMEHERLMNNAKSSTDEALTNSEVEEDLEESSAPSSPIQKKLTFLWTRVLWAYSRQDNEGKLLKVFDILAKRRAVSNARVAELMLDFYLRRNDMEHVRAGFNVLLIHLRGEVQNGDPPIGKYLKRVLKWCLRHNQLGLGHEIVRNVMLDYNPEKPAWDAVFVWAAGTGKGPDEINRMISVMENTNKKIADQDQWRIPDIDTINALVEFATSKNDPYTAERFIALGKERNLLPDARTYVLQMEYRLKVQDVDGALIAYTNLQSMDVSTNEDVQTVNKLIVALCNSKRHDFDTIMNVAADLSDRRARFEPLTVSRLALLHLSRDEVADVTDLLKTHAFHYSSSEREGICDEILAFCVNPDTPLPRSWDAYTVLRHIFDEMSRPQRSEIMANYFKRERPDMAVHVFNGMRAHSRSDTIPTVETYISAFLGSARLQDLESLELVHNQLKLDYNVNITTSLNNALIIGYTACGKPRKAIDFWDDIVASKEGPTYNSIHITMRACEKAPFGDLKAQEIWAKLRKRNVELDQSMWASYAAALAGNGDNELAISTLEQAEVDKEVELDAVIIGSLYAGASGQSKQDEIEVWAKEKYPHAWEELERIGFDVDEYGVKTAKIDRTVTP